MTDLPPTGRPADRSLAAAGYTALEQLAGRRDAELLQLHGVGPKALRILNAALQEHGLEPMRSGPGH